MPKGRKKEGNLFVWNQIKFSLPAIFIVFFVVLMPDHGYGGATGYGTCACGHNISGGAESCRRHMCPGGAHGNRYANMAGCSGKSTSSGSSGYSPGADFGKALGQMFNELSSRRSAKRKALRLQRELERKERERIQKERRIQACNNKKVDQKKFRNEKVALLGQMKGTSFADGDLGLKDMGSEAGIGIVKMDFDTYVDDERTRRETLAKLKGDKVHGWCLMNAPLRPTPPIGGPDCNFELAVDRYTERQIYWERKCVDSVKVSKNDNVKKSSESTLKMDKKDQSESGLKFKDLEFKLQDSSVVDLRDKDTSQPVKSPSFKNK